jgi:hypothetical protein
MRGLLVALGLLLCVAALAAQPRLVPLATEADRLLSRISVAIDGRTLTIRGPAPDDLRVCVEPAGGRFGRTICYAARDLRRGLK